MSEEMTLLGKVLKDGILWLTMDNPPANALSNALLRDLVGTLEAAVDDRSIRGLVLRGAGDHNQIDRNDLSCIIYTSGTTGLPKGVPLSHRNNYARLVSFLMSTGPQFDTDGRTFGAAPHRFITPWACTGC